MTSLEREILISRIVDGVASDGDWEALDRLGSTDHGVWRDLADAQRQHSRLIEALDRQLAVAEAVELPEHVTLNFPSTSGKRWWWAGWAVAALIAVGSFSGMLSSARRNGSGGSPVVTAGPAFDWSDVSQDELIKKYLDRGQERGSVVGQIPTKVLLETRPAEDGDGYDVYYLRQIVERVRVPVLQRTTEDELGRTRLVPVRVAPSTAEPM